MYGLCTCTERSDKGKNKGYVQPYKKAAFMFRRWDCFGTSHLFSYKKYAWHKRIGNAYDYHNAPMLFACII